MMKSRHGNNFNLLRFVFAGLVILSHAPEIRDGDRHEELLTQLFGTLSFGEFAVDCFFILSGFLILKSWHEHPDMVGFAASRVLRIYPGFVAASLICALIVGPYSERPHTSMTSSGRPISAHWSAWAFAEFRTRSREATPKQ